MGQKALQPGQACEFSCIQLLAVNLSNDVQSSNEKGVKFNLYISYIQRNARPIMLTPWRDPTASFFWKAKQGAAGGNKEQLNGGRIQR